MHEVYPAANAARSARLYTVEPRDFLRADRAAEAAGWGLHRGLALAHPHARPTRRPRTWPRPLTPDWHYVLVSLSDSEPVVRSYRIVAGRVEEEPVVSPA